MRWSPGAKALCGAPGRAHLVRSHQDNTPDATFYAARHSESTTTTNSSTTSASKQQQPVSQPHGLRSRADRGCDEAEATARRAASLSQQPINNSLAPRGAARAVTLAVSAATSCAPSPLSAELHQDRQLCLRRLPATRARAGRPRARPKHTGPARAHGSLSRAAAPQANVSTPSPAQPPLRASAQPLPSGITSSQFAVRSSFQCAVRSSQPLKPQFVVGSLSGAAGSGVGARCAAETARCLAPPFAPGRSRKALIQSHQF
jgi:hypothetical protein